MTEKCKHCGNTHETRCPLVKSIEYFEDGTIKRIEYMTPADYITMPLMPHYVPYPVPQPYPVYPQPYQPFIPVYPITISGYPSGTIVNSTGGSHSTLYNS